MKILGIILIVIGLLAFVIPSITFTRKEKILDIGPIEAVAEKKESLPLSPLLGVSALAVGGALVVAAFVTKKK